MQNSPSSSIPLETNKSFHEAQTHLIPKIKKKYLQIFQKFLKYLNLKNYKIIQLNENESNIKEFNKCLMKVVNHKVLVSYFNDLSKKYKSSTLWSIKGGLSKMLLVHGINLKDPQFSCIDQFLKDLHRTHKSKKSSFFSRRNGQIFNRIS